jgi:excisionase family DNA binding protein
VSIAEAAALLRMSRAQLYNRINDDAIKSHKDGARTYIARSELERYVDSCS